MDSKEESWTRRRRVGPGGGELITEKESGARRKRIIPWTMRIKLRVEPRGRKLNPELDP